MSVDWENLPGWLVLVPAFLVLYLLFLFYAIQAYRDGEWDKWKGKPERPWWLGGGASEEGCFAAGMICLFSVGVLYARSELHWALVIGLGAALGLFIVICFSLVIHAAMLSIYWIVERLMAGKK